MQMQLAPVWRHHHRACHYRALRERRMAAQRQRRQMAAFAAVGGCASLLVLALVTFHVSVSVPLW